MIDVRKLRRGTGRTQAEFGQLFGISVATVERLESKRGRISGPLELLFHALANGYITLPQLAAIREMSRNPKFRAAQQRNRLPGV